MKALAFMDYARWHNNNIEENQGYKEAGESAEAKILGHYLCYLTNRQMPVERVWGEGLPILCSLSKEFVENGMNAFDKYVDIDNDYKLTFKQKDKPKEIGYRPRYWTTDTPRIYRALYVFNYYNNSIGNILKKAINNQAPCENTIKKLFCVVHAIGYSQKNFSVNKPYKELFERNLNKFKKHQDAEAKKIIRTIANMLEESKFDNKFYKKSKFDAKITWCILRDWFLETNLNRHFVNTLKKAGVDVDIADKWKRDSDELLAALKWLELPGDIWNNNKKFWNCLFKDKISRKNDNKKIESEKYAREIYDYYKVTEREKIEFYPENFDITFDFVRRMCSENQCKVCPFNNGIEDLCHNGDRKICPVLLYACGYQFMCNAKKCKLQGLNLAIKNI